MLSIVIPTFNEMQCGFLSRILQELQAHPKRDLLEILCIDSHSDDGTAEFIQSHEGVIYEAIEPVSRGARLDAGLRRASNSLVLLHHPRSVIASGAIDYFTDDNSLVQRNSKIWGGLSHRFDLEHRFLKFISNYSNSVRSKRKGIVYLDHCIFLHKEALLSRGGVPDIDIFEDTAISEIMREVSQPIILPYVSTTSAIRFVENGIYRQFLGNQLLKLGYKLKLPHDLMNRWYERRRSLNTRYFRT